MTARLAPAFAASLIALSTAAASTPYSADFTETRSLQGSQQPLILHGHVAFLPGQRLDWAITRPYRYRLVVHDGRIEEHLPDGTVQTSALAKSPWAAALFDLFSALFTGNTDALARYFKVAPHAQGFDLVPRSKVLAQSVARIVVVGAPVPRTVIIEEADGGRTRIAFQAHSPLPPAGTEPAPADGG